MPKPIAPFSPQQKAWVMMVAAGKTRHEIYKEIFNIDTTNPDDKKAANAADQRLLRWRRHPDYNKELDAAGNELWRDIEIEAKRELRNGLRDEDNAWRRTQHVNLALAYSSKALHRDDSNTVTVQIAGLPDLGSPDQDDG